MAAPAPLVSIFFSVVALFDGNASVTTGASAGCATGSFFTGSGSARTGTGSACGGSTAAITTGVCSAGFRAGGAGSASPDATTTGAGTPGRLIIEAVPSAGASVLPGRV